MKRIFKMCSMVLAVVLFSAAKNPVAAQQATVTYQTFYDDLSPYGQWIDYPEYGYVWHPYANNFRPYSSEGHWIWTDDYGWMWASDYEWGWAPFHYGRWLYDDFYGWVWIPGYEWSPAWVQWRTGGDYYGWAPLGPGVNIQVNFSFGAYSAPYNYWCFVPRNYIMSPRVYDYCLPASRNTVIINRTTIINNYRRTNNVFVTGPRRNDVERYAGRINPFVLRQASRPGRTHIERNTVNVYRPRVERRNEQHVTPRHFERYNRQNGNAFKDRNKEIVNNERGRRIEMQRRTEVQNREQRENKNVFQQRQQEINRQNEIRRQQQQRNSNNIERERQRNKNAFEQRQNEMRQQQEQKRRQTERINTQRQNQVRQQQQRREQEQKNNFRRRQTEMRQQQRNNSEHRQNKPSNNVFQQRQQQHNNGKGHDKHGHH